MKYKIGDRIKCNGRVHSFLEDKKGIVLFVSNDAYAVEFDFYHSAFHSCAGFCKEKRGYWVTEKEIDGLMPKYKVGDIVKIRDDLEEGKDYGKHEIYCNNRMAELKGTLKKIKAIDEDYFYLEGSSGWIWVEEMFDNVVSPVVEIIEKEKEVEKEMAKRIDLGETIEKAIVESVIPIVEKRIMENVEDITKRVTTIAVTVNDDEIKETVTQAHKQFKNVLTLINNKIPVMLVGSAGSGKTGTCEKIAECLGLKYYFSNAITQEYKLTGFIDANGKYQDTQFYKAFKNGGLFVLDEIDASVPEALVILNTAIANGYFDFPNGKVKAHKNFRIVACANTYGLGADDIYVGRYQLDGASLDRFAVVEFDYDNVLEKALVENEEWAEFIQLLRERIREKRLRHILSMRATIYGDKLIKTDMPLKEIFSQIIFKNLKVDDIKTLGKIDDSKNPFVHAYNKYIDSNCTSCI